MHSQAHTHAHKYAHKETHKRAHKQAHKHAHKEAHKQTHKKNIRTFLTRTDLAREDGGSIDTHEDYDIIILIIFVGE